jgi:hypothetical protein
MTWQRQTQIIASKEVILDNGQKRTNYEEHSSFMNNLYNVLLHKGWVEIRN